MASGPRSLASPMALPSSSSPASASPLAGTALLEKSGSLRGSGRALCACVGAKRLRQIDLLKIPQASWRRIRARASCSPVRPSDATCRRSRISRPFATIEDAVLAGLGPGDDPYAARTLIEALGLDGSKPPVPLSGGETVASRWHKHWRPIRHSHARRAHEPSRSAHDRVAGSRAEIAQERGGANQP